MGIQNVPSGDQKFWFSCQLALKEKSLFRTLLFTQGIVVGNKIKEMKM